MIYFLWIAPMLVLVAWWYLRNLHGSDVKRSAKKIAIPSMPSPLGIITRMDGPNVPNRKIIKGSVIEAKCDGSIEVPKNWEETRITSASELGEAAFAWALASWNDENPVLAKRSKKSRRLANIVPVFAVLICIFGAISGKIPSRWALTIPFYVWMFFALMGLQSMLHYWGVARTAIERFRETGLMPVHPDMQAIIEESIKSQPWLNLPAWPK